MFYLLVLCDILAFLVLHFVATFTSLEKFVTDEFR